jgi:hypothetical protein
MDEESAESVYRDKCMMVKAIAAPWIDIHEQSGGWEHLEWSLTYIVLRR